MKTLLLIITLFILFSCSKEQEIIKEDYSACEPELIAPDNAKADFETGLIEFDIIPDKSYEKNHNKGAADKSKLWTKGIIPYYFTEDAIHEPTGGTIMGFTDEDNRNNVRQALRELSDATGLQFPEYKDRQALQKDYNNGVRLALGFANNSSHVGMQGGIQPIHITISAHIPYIKHEFSHAAGLLHEFTRSDRDEYVIVHYDNIHQSYRRQFDIYGGEANYQGDDCGPFDFDSIMMYPSFKVAIDSTQPTMTTLDGSTWGDITDLSQGDIKTIQTLYKNEFALR